MRRMMGKSLLASVFIGAILLVTALPASAHFIRQNSPNNTYFGEISADHLKIKICHTAIYESDGKTEVNQRNGTRLSIHNQTQYTGVCWSRYVTSEPVSFRVCDRKRDGAQWHCTSWRGV